MDELERPTIHDDTSNDHERFERRQLARDRDRRTEDILSIDESVASDLVYVLRDEGVVDVIPEDELLVHVPSGQKFRSNLGLAYFHQGWEANE
ncbi:MULTISPECIES: hypothetical protein [unclassified Haloferax]|jgi:hypothetical protein|uniref:hypothetical protein n=1 Tax=unclassified Haloferax TaxID=2625095 RepID=UPI002876637B|nr:MULTISPECIES: hypothetical protein [unclassified Haloferax]MDS0243090.1 hypothetical protein [Haloferax sp. S2CR25]MDS0446211.1 hypothetical protein [Haloferax sp. S2CR25-2]